MGLAIFNAALAFLVGLIAGVVVPGDTGIGVAALVTLVVGTILNVKAADA